MRLDDLALPLGIDEVGKALRRVLWLHQGAIVTNRNEPGANRCVQPVCVDMLRRKMLDHVLAHVGRKPAIALPRQKMSRIRAGDDVDGIDMAVLLLTNALKYPLRARALDANGDPRIFRLEHLAELFRDLKLPRRIEADLALLPRRLDQARSDGRRFGRKRLERLRENSPGRQCRRCLEYVASRKLAHAHCASSLLIPLHSCESGC